MDSNQPTVLVLDDVPALVTELEFLLTLERIPTVSARTIAATVNALHLHPTVRVVIADVRLGPENGYDVLKAIQADTHLCQRPIRTLFMTGETSFAPHRASETVLTKPFDIDTFIATVRSLLDTDQNP